MPRDPEGRKRPADVIGNAVHVMRLATGQIEEGQPPNAARAKGGRAGGKARAQALSRENRSKIAKEAATARWKKTKEDS
jgi:hypothetical protein